MNLTRPAVYLSIARWKSAADRISHDLRPNVAAILSVGKCLYAYLVHYRNGMTTAPFMNVQWFY